MTLALQRFIWRDHLILSCVKLFFFSFSVNARSKADSRWHLNRLCIHTLAHFTNTCISGNISIATFVAGPYRVALFFCLHSPANIEGFTEKSLHCTVVSVWHVWFFFVF